MNLINRVQKCISVELDLSTIELSIEWFILITNAIYAEKLITEKSGKPSKNNLKETAAGCAAGSGFKYLDINNIRTPFYSDQSPNTVLIAVWAG